MASAVYITKQKEYRHLCDRMRNKFGKLLYTLVWTELGGSVYLIHFQRMKFEDFASRNVKYFELFSLLEVTNILQILADKDFKSNLFTTKPLSYKIFTWDEKRILECSLSDKLSNGKSRKMNGPNESFTLSCNKPLLLISKIKFTKVRLKSAAITITNIAKILFELF